MQFYSRSLLILHLLSSFSCSRLSLAENDKQMTFLCSSMFIRDVQIKFSILFFQKHLNLFKIKWNQGSKLRAFTDKWHLTFKINSLLWMEWTLLFNVFIFLEEPSLQHCYENKLAVISTLNTFLGILVHFLNVLLAYSQKTLKHRFL